MRNKHSLANFARFVSIAIVSELCLSERSERVSGGTIYRRRSKTGENSRECVYAWRGGGFRTYCAKLFILCSQHLLLFLGCLVSDHAYDAYKYQSDKVGQASRYEQGQTTYNAENTLPPFHVAEYEST